MNKWLIGVGIVVLGGVAWVVATAGTQGGAEIEYRYSPVTEGELLLSTSSVGVLVPLTQVDIRSKAGGKVVELRVEEGSVVKRGDVIAVIDPEDTRTVYEQAQADVNGAQARVSSAQTSAALERSNAEIRVRDAELSLQMAQIALNRALQRNDTQPTLSQAEVRSAQAALDSARESARLLREVTIPQSRRDAEGNLARAKADLAAAEAEFERQEKLLERGFVSLGAVERQRSVLASSQASFNAAQQRVATLEAEFDAQSRTADARVRQADEALRQAKANQSQVTITKEDLAESRRRVDMARVALEKAKSDRRNVLLRQADVQSAQAGAVRSRVAMRNALVQLEGTTVVAPRDGVVTLKYLEEGTIIPPGTSTFSQGTSLVQISDVTQMQVECSVDEADIATIRIGQPVRVIVEAYPGRPLTGKVDRIFPAATTNQSLTTIKVRVDIDRASLQKSEKDGRPLRPGMNGTCEFIQEQKPKVAILPSQAIKREGGKTFVRVKSSDPKKPVQREVKLGMTGNDGVEVLEGVKPGEEVVVAEIDLKALRERQQRMEQSQQGGGFGSVNRGGPSQSRASGGGGRGGGGGGR